MSRHLKQWICAGGLGSVLPHPLFQRTPRFQVHSYCELYVFYPHFKSYLTRSGLFANVDIEEGVTLEYWGKIVPSSEVKGLPWAERRMALDVKTALFDNPKESLVCIASIGCIAGYILYVRSVFLTYTHTHIHIHTHRYANDPLNKTKVNATYYPNEEWNGGLQSGLYNGGAPAYLTTTRKILAGEEIYVTYTKAYDWGDVVPVRLSGGDTDSSEGT